MESQPQNPEFRNNPENFHMCNYQNNGQSLHSGWSIGNQGVPSNSPLRLSYFIFMENFQRIQGKINKLSGKINKSNLPL